MDIEQISGIFGAGVDLVAACDVRIASPSASFRLPGLQFGVVLGTRHFAALVGQAAARDILSSGRTFSAMEGLRLGLLTHVSDEVGASEILTRQIETCTLLDPSAQAALYRHTAEDARAEDMAALARSVSTPRLRFRILEFQSPRT